MFTKNEGTFDRVLRIIAGLALIAAYFLTTGGSYHWLYLIGIVPVITGVSGTCPLYSMLGISTCPINHN